MYSHAHVVVCDDKRDYESQHNRHLPDGHRVRLISGRRSDTFLEVETSLNGALLRGFAASQFLTFLLKRSRTAKPRCVKIARKWKVIRTGFTTIVAKGLKRRKTPANR